MVKSAIELVEYISCHLVMCDSVLNVFFTFIVIYTSWVLKLHMELRFIECVTGHMHSSMYKYMYTCQSQPFIYKLF